MSFLMIKFTKGVDKKILWFCSENSIKYETIPHVSKENYWTHKKIKNKQIQPFPHVFVFLRSTIKHPIFVLKISKHPYMNNESLLVLHKSKFFGVQWCYSTLTSFSKFFKKISHNKKLGNGWRRLWLEV